MKDRIGNFDNRVRETRADIESLKLEIGGLGEGLTRLREMVTRQLERTAAVRSQNKIKERPRLRDYLGL